MRMSQPQKWNGGALQNAKFQAPNLKVLGFGCRVSGVRID
jgi:hypothetical protein